MSDTRLVEASLVPRSDAASRFPHLLATLTLRGLTETELRPRSSLLPIRPSEVRVAEVRAVDESAVVEVADVRHVVPP